MARKFNSSDPTANKAVSNVMKSGRRKGRVNVRFAGDRCLVSGPRVDVLISRATEGEPTIWSAKYQAFIVTPAVARQVVTLAERAGYDVSANG